MGDHVEEGEIIGGELCRDGRQGDGGRGREVEGPLEAGVENDGVETGVLGCDPKKDHGQRIG